MTDGSRPTRASRQTLNAISSAAAWLRGRANHCGNTRRGLFDAAALPDRLFRRALDTLEGRPGPPEGSPGGVTGRSWAGQSSTTARAAGEASMAMRLAIR